MLKAEHVGMEGPGSFLFLPPSPIQQYLVKEGDVEEDLLDLELVSSNSSNISLYFSL